MKTRLRRAHVLTTAVLAALLAAFPATAAGEAASETPSPEALAAFERFKKSIAAREGFVDNMSVSYKLEASHMNDPGIVSAVELVFDREGRVKAKRKTTVREAAREGEIIEQVFSLAEDIPVVSSEKEQSVELSSHFTVMEIRSLFPFGREFEGFDGTLEALESPTVSKVRIEDSKLLFSLEGTHAGAVLKRRR